MSEPDPTDVASLPFPRTSFVLPRKLRYNIESALIAQFFGEISPPIFDEDEDIQFIVDSTCTEPSVLQDDPELPECRVIVPGDDIAHGSFFSSDFGIGVAYSYDARTYSESEFLFSKTEGVWQYITPNAELKAFNKRMNLFLLAFQQVV